MFDIKYFEMVTSREETIAGRILRKLHYMKVIRFCTKKKKKKGGGGGGVCINSETDNFQTQFQFSIRQILL